MFDPKIKKSIKEGVIKIILTIFLVTSFVRAEIFSIIKKGSLEEISELIDDHKELLLNKNKFGESPLDFAIRILKPEVIKIITDIPDDHNVTTYLIENYLENYEWQTSDYICSKKCQFAKESLKFLFEEKFKLGIEKFRFILQMFVDPVDLAGAIGHLDEREMFRENELSFVIENLKDILLLTNSQSKQNAFKIFKLLQLTGHDRLVFLLLIEYLSQQFETNLGKQSNKLKNRSFITIKKVSQSARKVETSSSGLSQSKIRLRSMRAQQEIIPKSGSFSQIPNNILSEINLRSWNLEILKNISIKDFVRTFFFEEKTKKYKRASSYFEKFEKAVRLSILYPKKKSQRENAFEIWRYLAISAKENHNLQSFYTIASALQSYQLSGVLELDDELKNDLIFYPKIKHGKYLDNYRKENGFFPMPSFERMSGEIALSCQLLREADISAIFSDYTYNFLRVWRKRWSEIDWKIFEPNNFFIRTIPKISLVNESYLEALHEIIAIKNFKSKKAKFENDQILEWGLLDIYKFILSLKIDENDGRKIISHLVRDCFIASGEDLLIYLFKSKIILKKNRRKYSFRESFGKKKSVIEHHLAKIREALMMHFNLISRRKKLKFDRRKIRIQRTINLITY